MYVAFEVLIDQSKNISYLLKCMDGSLTSAISSIKMETLT